MATEFSQKTPSSEDHMDLGPFLQEYVLRNPFNPTIQTTSSPRSGSSSPTLPSSDNCRDKQVNPALVDIDKPGGHIGSNLGYAHQLKELKLPRRHAKVRHWLLQHYKFASFHSGWMSSDALLKEAKINFPDMKSSVLSRIMKFTYPDCRKVINKYGYFYLGLVKRPTGACTFNICQKCQYIVHVDNQLGLLPAADFLKKSWIEAAKEINVSQNNVTCIAQKHSINADKLAAIYVWLDEGPAPGATPHKKERKRTGSTSSDKETENEDEWQPKYSIDVNGENDENGNNKSLKWSLRKRTRSRVIGYLKNKLKKIAKDDESNYNENDDTVMKRQKDENDDDETLHSDAAVKIEKDIDENEYDFELPESPVKLGEVVKIKPEPKDDYSASPIRDTSDTSRENATDLQDEFCTAIDMSMKSEKINQNTDKNSTGSCSTLSHVKPTSTISNGYTAAHTSTSDHFTPSKIASNYPILSSIVCPGGQSKDTALSSLVGRLRSTLAKEPEVVLPIVPLAKAAEVNAIADSLKYRQELELVKKDLAIREEENFQLQQDLRSSRQELSQLKEKLLLQNTLLTDLSTEFYDLSNHFMKVSHHFKNVISEVQRTAERIT